MSDDPTAPTTPVDSADTTTATTVDTPDPGTDWEKRANDNQAAFTRSQMELADERAAWQDEDKLLARIQEKYPHLIDEDPDEPELEPDEPGPDTAKPDPRVDAHEAMLARLAAKEADQEFESDLDAELGDREVPASARKWIKTLTLATGSDRDALKGAVDEWFDMTSPPAKKRPAAPHVPKGTPPQGESTDDLSIQDLTKHMANRLAAESQ